MSTTVTQEVAEFLCQSTLQPGEEGWWRVWGASARDIRAGDIVCTKDSSDYPDVAFVEETFTARSHPIRVGIVVEGQRQTLGALVPILLVRKGTHNTLSDSI